jgi:hypothetical protein
MRRAAAFAAILILPLTACSGPSAPQDDGVCWRSHGGTGPTAFEPVARGVQNLESCAVLLEAMRLRGGADVEGAYQGYFVFASATGISSGMHAGGLHYPVFQPPQRASIDSDLKRLMAEHGGQLPDVEALSIERK